jgi:hypothetical protein
VPAPRTAGEATDREAMEMCERSGRMGAALRGAGGQGTVEYVGLVLLVAVLIAGVVKASGSFSDTGIAEAVVKQLKGAIDGVAGGG